MPTRDLNCLREDSVIVVLHQEGMYYKDGEGLSVDCGTCLKDGSWLQSEKRKGRNKDLVTLADWGRC